MYELHRLWLPVQSESSQHAAPSPPPPMLTQVDPLQQVPHAHGVPLPQVNQLDSHAHSWDALHRLWVPVQSELAQQVVGFRLAFIELKRTQGVLAYECAFEAMDGAHCACRCIRL